MLILFDNGKPRGLAGFLIGHSVAEAPARGWEEFANGELIEAAEQAGFDVIVAAVERAHPGSYTEVAVPFKE